MMQINSEAILAKLKHANLRPTQQRLQLGHLLWGKMPCRHVTAEALHRESREANIQVSLATIYNTLHQFTQAGLLREIAVEGSGSYFDTNIQPHHHFLHEDTGELEDISAEQVKVSQLPVAPMGKSIASVDVVIRLKAQ